MASAALNFIGGNVLSGIKGLIDEFHLDPAKAAEFSAKLQDSITQQVMAAADIIKAEAQSQSWLPRNVRPLCLLVWALLITVNQIVPTIAKLWVPGLQPIPLDPWVYKLTALGFSGYVAARTYEKKTNSDN